MVDLKKELKKCRVSKDLIKNEYNKCENELRNKTEEVEILKVEIEDLKQILKLKDEMKNNELHEPNVAEEMTNLSKNNVKRRAPLQQKKMGGERK